MVGRPHEGLGGARNPTQKFGGPPASLARVGRHTRRFHRGREAQPEVRAGSGRPPGFSDEVGRPTQRFGRGREAHLKVRKWA